MAQESQRLLNPSPHPSDCGLFDLLPWTFTYSQVVATSFGLPFIPNMGEYLSLH
jgi:hypothetical protein